MLTFKKEEEKKHLDFHEKKKKLLRYYKSEITKRKFLNKLNNKKQNRKVSAFKCKEIKVSYNILKFSSLSF